MVLPPGMDRAVGWARVRLSRSVRRAPGLATAFVLSLGVVTSAALADTYFVDGSSPQCSPNGPGTLDQPFCSIAAAVSARGKAGNTILVQPGTYRETVSFSASGTSLAPIVLRANGPGVVIDGADDFSPSGQWAPYSGDVWLAAGVTWSPAQVFADGGRLTASGNPTSALPPGTFRYVAGEGLYVNAGGGNPGQHAARVGRRSYAFSISGKSWITIEGFTATGTEDRAFRVVNSSDVSILDCTVSFANKYGIYVSNGARVRLAGNLSTDNNNHGFVLTGGSTACLVENNEGARNAVPGTRSANGIYLYSTTNNTLRRNRWHDNQDTGEDFQAGANDNLSYDNVSWGNGDHGYDHLAATGNVHLNDVAYGNYKDGFSIEGTSPGTQLTNCIAVNNGLTTNEFDLWVDETSAPGLVSNDNLFWNTTSQQPFKYIATLYSTLADYQAASGQDSRSLQADPRFVNPATGDFHLLAGSPAIDNGNSSPPDWPATDADGHARANDPATPDAGLGPIAYSDRGAYEYQPAGLPPVAVLVASPFMTAAPASVTLDASGSRDPEGGPLTYRFDFGDGAGAGPQASPTVVHTYAAGTYAATVSVVDDMGLAASDTTMVIANQRPTAALTGSPLAGHDPLAVSFNASASSDADGTVATYTFDFGDGTILAPRTYPTASHVYAAGNWQATVTVTDDRGAVSLPSAPVAVHVTPPNQPPVAALSLSPPGGHAPLLVTADASASTDADGSIVSYRFTFGDGTVVGPQPGAIATHPFTSGTYTVSVQVTDNEGATGSASADLLVSPPDRAPIAVAPDTVTASEGGTLTVGVTASDPDGEPILTLAADLSHLPAGNDAVLTPAADLGSGQLVWHPTFADSGAYRVTFIAGNALADTVSTLVRIQNVDRAPVVSAPATLRSAYGKPLALGVSANDPDGDAIATFSVNLAVLPAGDTASFTPAADGRSGTFNWTPAARDTGTYALVFIAANAMSGSATTLLTITPPNLPPTAVLSATPQSGNELLTVTASAAGSTDPEGGPLSYRFDFGDGVVVGPQASATAVHKYSAGNWKLLATVTDTAGAASTDSASITVAPSGPGLNLVANPSFEFNTTGWASSSGSTFNRVAGGFAGSYSLRIAGPANLNAFGIDDSTNWVATTESAGARYRFSAWVRAVRSRGSAKLRVREFVGAQQVGATTFSTPVPLTFDWQLAAVEIAAQASGSTLDFQVLDQPVATSEIFLVDDVAIEIVPAAAPRTPFTANDPPPGAGDNRGQDGARPITAVPDSTAAPDRVPAPDGGPGRFSVSVVTGPATSGPSLALALTRPGPVQLDLYDLAGRRVRRVLDEAFMAPGLHSIALDVHGEEGRRLASGVYFYRVQAPERLATGRFVILR